MLHVRPHGFCVSAVTPAKPKSSANAILIKEQNASHAANIIGDACHIAPPFHFAILKIKRA